MLRLHEVMTSNEVGSNCRPITRNNAARTVCIYRSALDVSIYIYISLSMCVYMYV
jgi:hypothetical protein